jgi:hypothetical protein
MPENRIDLTISQDQVTTILASLKTIEDTLPGLVELTPEQRQGMARYSDKDLGFIIKTLRLAEQYPEILPPSFNLDEMRRDVDTLQKLDTILRAMTRITGKFHDSRYAAGSESPGHSRFVYQFVKTHNTLTGGLEDALADLGKKFARKASPSEKPAST